MRNHANTLDNISVASFALAALMAVSLITILAHDSYFNWPIALCISSLTCIAITGQCVFRKINSTNRIWRRSELGYYHKPVPDFALQTAKDIKEKCPDAKFFIEELEITNVPFADPFLIVKPDSYSKEEFYIEVWNEPKFKQKREV